ncbi:MAG: ATP-binding protein [Salibacteraceae bacterium]
MKRSIAFFITLLWTCSLAFGQESIQELEAAIEQAEGLKKLELRLDLAYALLKIDPERSISLGDFVITQTKARLKSDRNQRVLKIESSAYMVVGEGYFEIRNTRKAGRSYRNCLRLAEDNEFKTLAKKAEKRMEDLEEFELAQEIAQAKEDEKESSTSEPKGLKGLGRSIADRINAGTDEVANEANEMNQDRLERLAKSNEQSGNFEKAANLYEKTLKYLREKNDSSALAARYNKIGELFRKAGQFGVSMDYFDRALSYQGDLGDTAGAVASLAGIESVLNDLNESPDLLENDAKEAEETSQTYKALADDFAERGDFEKSLEYYKLYTSLQNEMVQREKDRQQEQLEAKNLMEQRGAELEQLKQQKRSQALDLREKELSIGRFKLIRNFLIIGLVLLIGLAVALYVLFATKRKSVRQVSEAYQQLDEAHSNLKKTQSRLVESEKMASLGQLTAGIAHEINNPINFVSANVAPLQRDLKDLKQLLKAYDQLDSKGNLEDRMAEIHKLRSELDPEFLYEEIDTLLAGIQEGAARTKNIVAGLRIFSRVDEAERKPANLNEGLQSTLTLLQNKLKNCIEVETHWGELPLVECQVGKINQVFMNLISNAIQAMGDTGKLTIATEALDQEVVISISDTGKGMDETTRQRIFEPFFTTKDVGEGTGLGLSISYGIIENHGGVIEVQSQPGEGATFLVKLPLNA